MPKVAHLAKVRSRRGSDEKLEPLARDVPSGKEGWIADWTDDGLVIDFAGNEAGPIVARSVVQWQREQVREAIETRHPVLLVFEEGDVRKPIIVGTMKPVPKRDASPTAEASPVQVLADGERVEVRGRDEVVLRCGEASITLRRNGRVVIKGAQVETRARGTNRIKGGNVLIN
jgi:hypothetical protein